jgi:hypothetical protein
MSSRRQNIVDGRVVSSGVGLGYLISPGTTPLNTILYEDSISVIHTSRVSLTGVDPTTRARNRCLVSARYRGLESRPRQACMTHASVYASISHSVSNT